MNREGMAFFTDINWPLAGLVIFFTLFIVLMVMLVRQYDKSKVEMMEKMPLGGD